jgi:hypothetical protein
MGISAVRKRLPAAAAVLSTRNEYRAAGKATIREKVEA